MTLTLGSLIYCLRDSEVLLMKRLKEPNQGLWVAPGGKLEASESPYECALREFGEKTGLQAQEAHYRGQVTLAAPSHPEWHWMLFLYAVTATRSTPNPSETRRDTLRWWPLSEMHRLPMPEADQVFMPHVVDLSRAPYEAKFVFSRNLRLAEVHEYQDGMRITSRIRTGLLRRLDDPPG